MRSSDWSSDVCSSDLIASGEAAWQSRGPVNRPGLLRFARNDAESGFLTIGPDDVRPPPRHHPSSHRLINLIGALAYAARIAGVRTRWIALSFSLFNILLLFSRTSNRFLGPFLPKTNYPRIHAGTAPP